MLLHLGAISAMGNYLNQMELNSTGIQELFDKRLYNLAARVTRAHTRVKRGLLDSVGELGKALFRIATRC